MPTTLNTDIAELCRHRLGQLFLFSFLSQALPFQPGKETMDRFCPFPSGQMSIKSKTLLQLFFYYSSYTPWKKYVSTRTSSRGEDFNSHYSFSLSFFSVTGGQAEATTISQEGTLFHINAHFQHPNSEKHHYTRQYFEHMLKCCPEHRWTSTHV